MNREVETGRFRARTESGKEYIIIQYQEFISAATFDNPHAEIPGLKRLSTSDGFSVNYIDPTTFKIIGTGETVRKV